MPRYPEGPHAIWDAYFRLQDTGPHHLDKMCQNDRGGSQETWHEWEFWWDWQRWGPQGRLQPGRGATQVFQGYALALHCCRSLRWWRTSQFYTWSSSVRSLVKKWFCFVLVAVSETVECVVSFYVLPSCCFNIKSHLIWFVSYFRWKIYSRVGKSTRRRKNGLGVSSEEDFLASARHSCFYPLLPARKQYFAQW